jgi:hypothetical protein
VGLAAWALSTQASDPLFAKDDFGPAVEAAVLSGQRGGDGLSVENLRLQLSSASLNAEVSKNALTSGLTGSNTVTNGAFSNAQGIATVIQNSGNQVIIQNNTIINLTLQ